MGTVAAEGVVPGDEEGAILGSEVVEPGTLGREVGPEGSVAVLEDVVGVERGQGSEAIPEGGRVDRGREVHVVAAGGPGPHVGDGLVVPPVAVVVVADQQVDGRDLCVGRQEILEPWVVGAVGSPRVEEVAEEDDGVAGVGGAASLHAVEDLEPLRGVAPDVAQHQQVDAFALPDGGGRGHLEVRCTAADGDQRGGAESGSHGAPRIQPATVAGSCGHTKPSALVLACVTLRLSALLEPPCVPTLDRCSSR